jgi:hypothetical protein
MRCSARFFLSGTVILFLSISAIAEDEITVSYLGGNPPPDRSVEQVTIRVSRLYSPPNLTETSKLDVDRFFEQISSVLAKNKIASDWQLVIVDAGSIRLTINIDGQKRILNSSHVDLERSGEYLLTERGMEAIPYKDRDSVLAKQSETFRHNRIAFDAILQLTLDRARTKLSP